MRAFIIASVFLVVGCGGGVEGELTSYKDKMCSCPDKECAEKVFTDYRAWAKGKRDEAKNMSKEQQDKLDGIDKELKDCRRKFRDADKAAPTGSGSAATPTTP